MRKHLLDILILLTAALSLAFTVGYFIGRNSISGITVERGVTVDFAPILDEDIPIRDTNPEEHSIDLNTASVYELNRLPGIGMTIAERIVNYREETGGFASTEELMEVYGIGEKLYNQVEPYITVDR